jgi:hypothetical protein
VHLDRQERELSGIVEHTVPADELAQLGGVLENLRRF